jgi:MFS family permease
MNALPSKQELLAFQARWMRRAGAVAVAGAFIVTAATVLQRAGLNVPSGNSDADQLAFTHAHSARLILSAVIQGIGFSLFLAPLLFLFRSAQGRAERVRGAFVGLVVVGPLAFGAGLAISAVGSSDSADKFAEQAPAVERQARERAQAAASAPTQRPDQKAKPVKSGAASTPTTSATSTSGTNTSTASGATTSAAKPKTPDQAASEAREGLADHLNKHTTLLLVGSLVSTIGILALVFGLIYTPLWSMRVGLLTRFWGALGMATGFALLILGLIGIALIVLWFAALGLMFLGRWPRPLPPAWAAGEAIPWLRPGEDLGPPVDERESSGAVEGSGREVSEPRLEQNVGPIGEPEQGSDQSAGEAQGERRKKRKRRK